MSSDGANAGSHVSRLEYPVTTAGRLATAREAAQAGGPDAPFQSPPSRQLIAVALLGAVLAAGVGYEASRNPAAAPTHGAAFLRVAIVAALIGAGIYAHTSRMQARMGRLLIAAGLFSALWLMNGSRSPVLFSIGVVCGGLAPAVFAYLLLAHPTGRLRSSGEERFLMLTGSSLAALWLLATTMTTQPALRTPLLRCGAGCPHDVLSVGSAPHLVAVVRVAVAVALVALVCGTPILLLRRARAASAPMRCSLLPIEILAIANALLFCAYWVAEIAGLSSASDIGIAYIATAIAAPVAILLGLAGERLFMGHALAVFVNRLAASPQQDPRALMALALRDPTLRIAYRRPGRDRYVDPSGAPIEEPGADRAITWVERENRPIAAVIYDAQLADQEAFIHAAGAAALMQLERAQLEAEMNASLADLAASRSRLLESADAERRRLERDLHDGVQQQLVGLRIKLDLAADTVQHDPARGEQEIADVGQQMDDALQSLRSLARGIYPSLLHDWGVTEALKSAARMTPVPASVRAEGVGRYAEEIEIAVYFCCIEALQNVVDHAGSGARAAIRLWQEDGHLLFEVTDSGVGVDTDAADSGSGIINMRDRAQAVGGSVDVVRRHGRGTLVRGRFPAVGRD